MLSLETNSIFRCLRDTRFCEKCGILTLSSSHACNPFWRVLRLRANAEVANVDSILCPRVGEV